MPDTEEEIGQYNGLTKTEPSLPREAYLDARLHERDLERIWYRNWIYVGRADELQGPKSFRVFELGTQEVLILRDEEGQLQAFHNTCRHRGSLLVEEKSGCLRGPMIVCPYHRWAYSLQGDLQRVSSRSPQADFNKSDYSLYPVGIQDWNGFIFIHLTPEEASPLEESFGESSHLANWPLSDLQLVHTDQTILECNWKIFWENFNECLHCPNIHPELSRLVPLYKQSFMEVHDDPDWEQHQETNNKLFKRGLTEGAATWSADGATCAEPFPNLTQEEIDNGHNYCEPLPSAFIVGHVDYVRVVRVRPLAPEKTEIQAQWLFSPEATQKEGFDPGPTIEFGKKVIEQDGRASELNQKGLRSISHKEGVLLPEEYAVHAFHTWLKSHFD